MVCAAVKPMSTLYGIQISGNCLRAKLRPALAGKKLARQLLDWATDGESTKEGIRIKVSLTHGEIARLIGAARATVARVLSEFCQTKLAQLRDRLWSS